MKLYDINVKDYRRNEVKLSQYEGNVLLIVNSATACGFTPQYDDLQDLYERYNNQGFEILDFPCNQFGGQAPGTEEEIYEFCDSKYGITYPLHMKIEVNGENAHPLYKYLVSEKGFEGFHPQYEKAESMDTMLAKIDKDYKLNPDIKWNFTKFLVDREGKVIERFEPIVPMYVIEDRIKELL